MAKDKSNGEHTRGADNAAAFLDEMEAAIDARLNATPELAALSARFENECERQLIAADAAFEADVKRCAEQTGVDLWQARKWVRTFNSVNSFAATVAKLMGKDHGADAAKWARDAMQSALGDITRLLADGPELQLAMMYDSLIRAGENVKQHDFEAAIQALSLAGEQLPFLLDLIAEDKRGDVARRAANMRHGKPGGSRDKAAQIRALWATGKYTNRDRCAEEECRALDMSFSAARKALRNTPKPKRDA